MPTLGTCNVCGRERNVYVCSSSLAAMSIAICQECLTEGAESREAVDVTLWNGFSDAGFSAVYFDPGFLEGVSVYYEDRYMTVGEYIQQEGVLDDIKAQIDAYNASCKAATAEDIVIYDDVQTAPTTEEERAAIRDALKVFETFETFETAETFEKDKGGPKEST